MPTIFPVNLNTHWAYKECQFNKCLSVKIACSFPFGAVVQPEEICKALANVVAMVLSCKYFQFHVIHPPLFLKHFILPWRGPSLCMPNKSCFMDMFSQQLYTTTKQPFSYLVCRNLQANVPCQPLPVFIYLNLAICYGVFL